MSSLFREFGYRKAKGDLGIEVEVEASEDAPSLPSQNDLNALGTSEFECKVDGSLRGSAGWAYEYTSSQPVKVDDFGGHVNKIFEFIRRRNSKIVPSSRTSIHIHRNVGDLNKAQAVSAAIAYWFCEPFLLQLVAKHRMYSRFCVPAFSSDLIDQVYNSQAARDNPFSNLREDRVKYSGMNVYPATRIGSFEARSLELTEDEGKIIDWAINFDNVLKNGSNYKTPEKLMDALYSSAISDSVASLVTPQVLKRIDLKKRSSVDGAKSILKMASMLAYDFDWSIKKEEKKAPPNRVRNDLEFEAFVNEEGIIRPRRIEGGAVENRAQVLVEAQINDAFFAVPPPITIVGRIQ